MTDAVDIAGLSRAVLDSMPRDIDWSFDAVDEGDERRWWVAEEHTHTGWDETEHTVTLVFDRFNQVAAIFLADGTRIDDDETDVVNSDYVFEHTNDEGEPLEGALSADDLKELLKVEGETEGPMMNYWYPIGTIDYAVAGGGDMIEAAYRIRDSVCIGVEVDDSGYGLALAGGGMDLTWHIVRAFVALGYLPPVYFTNPPGFYEQDSEFLIACMKAAVVAQRGRLDHQLERLERQLLELQDRERGDRG